MSLRLASASGTSPDFWAKLQLNYDVWQAREQTLPKVKPFPRMAESA